MYLREEDPLGSLCGHHLLLLGLRANLCALRQKKLVFAVFLECGASLLGDSQAWDQATHWERGAGECCLPTARSLSPHWLSLSLSQGGPVPHATCRAVLRA